MLGLSPLSNTPVCALPDVVLPVFRRQSQAWYGLADVTYAYWEQVRRQLTPTTPFPAQHSQRFDSLPVLDTWREQFRRQPLPKTFLPTPFPVQHSQRFDPLPIIDSWWEQFRREPLPLTFLPTPFPRQHSQRHDNLPDFWQEWEAYSKPVVRSNFPPSKQSSQRFDSLPDLTSWWEQFRLQPVSQTFLPTPFPVQHSQRVDPLPNYWQEWSAYIAKVTTPNSPLSIQRSQRFDPLLVLDSWWEQFRHQPVALTLLPTPFPAQRSQRIDTLPDFWQEGLWERPSRISLSPPILLSVPPSQRFDSLPELNTWWEQFRRLPVPLSFFPFVSQQRSQRFEPLPDYWSEWSAYGKKSIAAFKFPGFSLAGLNLVMNARGLSSNNSTTLVLVGSSGNGFRNTLPLTIYSGPTGNVVGLGQSLYVGDSLAGRCPSNMNLTLSGAYYNLSMGLPLLLDNWGVTNGLSLFLGVDDAYSMNQGMDLFIERLNVGECTLYLHGPGTPMSQGVLLVVDGSVPLSGSVSLSMPFTDAYLRATDTLFVRGF